MKKKILHIEDNLPNRLLVRQVLEGAGFTVVEAIDGLSGIQVAQQEKPDLILMDINIPGMDGHEATTRIKSLPELSHVPIVAVTARVMAGDRERAIAAGCDGYIAKPIDVDALPGQVAEFLRGLRETITAEQESTYLREHNERVVSRLQEKVEELTKANEALKHTDAMKSRFIGLAAHELHTPLAVLNGYLSLLTASDSQFWLNADPDLKQIIEGMAISADRLKLLVQDMLDITRIEAGTLQLKHGPVNLAKLFKKIQVEFASIVDKREQTLIFGEATTIPIMWADGERILQMLRNLIGNAVKYTPNGGAIRVGAEFIGSDNLVEPSVGQFIATQFVKITVSDTGVGIPPDQQEHIFENFHEVREIEYHSTSKTDFMGGGAGLGLPIARGIAEAHGGSLWVESEGYDPEECPGSKFHIILPLGQLPG